MPNIYDEVKIIFRGPCERLFIAYKPLGWHVCSPSGKKKLDDSLSSVIGAKLRISEDSIKFPSKLKINQKGLVIGTTDDPMYNTITKIIENKQCSKTYSCLIEDSIQNFLSKIKDFNIILDNTSNLHDSEVSESSGTINFNLIKLQKKSQSDPDISIDLQPTSSSYSLKFNINNLMNIINNNNNNNYNYNIKQLSFDKNKYSILELETKDKLVDKYLMDILDNMGVKLVDQLDTKLNETHKTIHLNKIQIPHPILRDRRIITSVPLPLDTWIQYLSKYY